MAHAPHRCLRVQGPRLRRLPQRRAGGHQQRLWPCHSHLARRRRQRLGRRRRSLRRRRRRHPRRRR
ncbi:MAG: hypothetical protein CVU56_20930 [Deltaproteobacteria bacterium HGW-Deltaproteobacteria-14]|nr:MAG: hypothetical protein CVU56_20930 [Deltaproteobacteria bacterium HGW-Deltaproteobacteria-14]